MYEIDLQGSVPLYEQVYKKILGLVVSNTLKTGEQLPSVRTLAKELSINPNTIAKAYLQLENDKIIYSLSGRGSFVAEFDYSLLKNKYLSTLFKELKEGKNIGFSKEEIIDEINKSWERL